MVSKILPSIWSSLSTIKYVLSGIMTFCPFTGIILLSHMVASFQYFTVIVLSDKSFTTILLLFLNIISPLISGLLFKYKLTFSPSVTTLEVSGMYKLLYGDWEIFELSIIMVVSF